MVYEIFTYGGGEMLRDLFNGIAMVVGDNSYQTLINIFVLFAIVWVLITTAFGGRFTDIPRWGITFFLIMGIMLVPKSTVLITDQVKGGFQYTVDNIPFGLAFFASTASLIGNTLTEKIETNFSMPDDLKYHQAGAGMAGSVVRSSNQFRITDAQMSSDIRSFVQQCVQYDVLLGKYTLEELLTTNNIWALITSNPSPARAFLYRDEIKTCADGAQALQADWNTEINDRSFLLYGKRLFGDYLNDQSAKEELLHYLPVSYSYLLNLSGSAQDLMQQNMLINAFEEGILGSAAQVNAPAAVQNYAETRAMQQQRSAYQLTGEMAEHWLPIMQNVFEAILYGSFILILPMCLLPMGTSILKNYLFSLFWLQTWAPLYAILNMIMTHFTQNSSLQAAATHSGYALSVSTLPGIEQVNVDMGIVAAYLSMSIPFLSFYLIKGLAAGLGQMATHLGNLNQSAVMHGAEEATSGNYSMGNMNYKNWNAYNTSAHHFNDNLSYQSGLTSVQTDTGAMIHHTPDNTRVIETGHAVSNIPTSINFADSLRATYSKMSEDSTQAALSAGSQLAASQATMHRDLYDLSQRYGKSEHFDETHSSGESSSQSGALNQYQSAVDTFAEQQGIAKSQSASVLGSVSASFGLPRILGVDAGIRGELQGMSSARKQEVFNAAQDYVEQTNFNSVTEAAVRESHDLQHRSGNDISRSLSESINHSQEQSVSLRSEVASNLQKADSYRESASLSAEQSSSINTTASQQFVNHLEQEMGSATAVDELLTRNPAAAHAKAEAFVKEHHADIIAQTAQSDGLRSEAYVEKMHDTVNTKTKETSKAFIQSEAAHSKESIDQQSESLKEFKFSTSPEKIQGEINEKKESLHSEKQTLHTEGGERKEKVLTESNQEKNTITSAVKGAMNSISGIPFSVANKDKK